MGLCVMVIPVKYLGWVRLNGSMLWNAFLTFYCRGIRGPNTALLSIGGGLWGLAGDWRLRPPPCCWALAPGQRIFRWGPLSSPQPALGMPPGLGGRAWGASVTVCCTLSANSMWQWTAFPPISLGKDPVIQMNTTVEHGCVPFFFFFLKKKDPFLRWCPGRSQNGENADLWG